MTSKESKEKAEYSHESKLHKRQCHWILVLLKDLLRNVTRDGTASVPEQAKNDDFQ